MSHSPARERLNAKLRERNQAPDRVAAIDDEIAGEFQRPMAVLMLDMCGFSRISHHHGIIAFLAMIVQMEEAARPAVEGNGGRVVKQEADNLLAAFPRPEQALEAALDVFRAFEAINTVVPDERDIRGSVGIGYGPMLVVGDDDLYGTELNFASKLGEDLACAHEILLTAAAWSALPEGRYRGHAVTHRISGLEIVCHKFEAVIHEDATPAPPGP